MLDAEHARARTAVVRASVERLALGLAEASEDAVTEEEGAESLKARNLAGSVDLGVDGLPLRQQDSRLTTRV